MLGKEKGFLRLSLWKKISAVFLIFFWILAMIVPWVSSSGVVYATEEKKIYFMVSIFPQAYFIKKIGGTKVEVNVLLPKGFDPVSYEPTIQKMLQIEKADFYFKVGVESFPLEKRHLPTLLSYHPSVKVLDMSKNITRLSFENPVENKYTEDKQAEDEHKDEKHDHAGFDPHIWTSPTVAEKASKTIYEALARFDPKNQKYYQNRLNQFLRQIQRVDREIRNTLSQTKNKKFIVYHPSWSYFAKDYGLVQVAIEREGKEGTFQYIKRIIDLARRENIRVVFVQSGFPKESARVIAKEFSAQVLELNPLAENWIANIRRVSKILRKSFLLSE